MRFSFPAPRGVAPHILILIFKRLRWPNSKFKIENLKLKKNCACNVGTILFVFVSDMKMKIFAALAGIGLGMITVGCVSTVSDTHTAGIYMPDSVVGRYQRPLDDVYSAAVQVVTHDGVLLTEYMPHDTTNAVRSLYAKVNQEKVWIRVEAVDPQITQVTVQARTVMGGDTQEAHELDKEIALQLARQ